MNRFIKLAVLAVSVLGLVATAAPPARAFTAFEASFVGNAQVGSGLAYPCADDVSTTTTGTGLPCPPDAPTVNCLPLPGVPSPLDEDPPNCHPHFEHGTQAVTVSSTTCVGLAEHVLKPLPAVTGPACTFGGGGHVSGYCGLSGGQVRGTITFGGHVLSFDVHFTGVGGELVVTGHYTNPTDPAQHHGLLTGVVTAVPPTPVLTPGQSCLNQTARDFQIVGAVTGVPHPLL